MHTFFILKMSSKFFTLRMFGGSTLEQTLTQAHSFTWGPRLYLSTLEDTYINHSHDKLDQTFPLCSCIQLVIKNWMVGTPVNQTAKIHSNESPT